MVLFDLFDLSNLQCYIKVLCETSNLLQTLPEIVFRSQNLGLKSVILTLSEGVTARNIDPFSFQVCTDLRDDFKSSDKFAIFTRLKIEGGSKAHYGKITTKKTVVKITDVKTTQNDLEGNRDRKYVFCAYGWGCVCTLLFIILTLPLKIEGGGGLRADF